MAVQGEPDPVAVRVATAVAGSSEKYPDFALVDLSSSELPLDLRDEIAGAAYDRSITSVTHLHPRVLWEIGAHLVRRGPAVAGPEARLASEADFVAFAAAANPGLGNRDLRHRTTPAWNALGRAAKFIQAADQWTTLLSVVQEHPRYIALGSNGYTPAELARIARLPLRFVLPHDHEATDTTELSVDLDSLHATLDDILAEGYKRASGRFYYLGRKGLNLLARFAMDRVPDRGPLPVLEARDA